MLDLLPGEAIRALLLLGLAYFLIATSIAVLGLVRGAWRSRPPAHDPHAGAFGDMPKLPDACEAKRMQS
jgi:hypothetical protein